MQFPVKSLGPRSTTLETLRAGPTGEASAATADALQLAMQTGESPGESDKLEPRKPRLTCS